ncbi:MAG: methyltransferase [Propionibacteriaceae bacterium]|jgi:methylase of polypeptide subunit release factors|nr:methyltransferase [Propionibacteriaceae bacterium]
MSTYTDAMSRLREVLIAVDYRVDSVMEAITTAGQSDLERNHTVAACRALGQRTDRLATLIRLFILQQVVPSSQALAAIDVSGLAELGLITVQQDQVAAMVDIRPFLDESTQASGWVVSDHAASVDTRVVPPTTDHVLGMSPASVSLSQITPRHEVGAALDLGTGCGIQSLYLCEHARQVVATDLNPRALTMASLTFALNDVRVDARLGSLYEPVADEVFDLITTNPPFVIAPPSDKRLTYREAGLRSDDLMKAVIQQAGPRLAPGGSLHVLGNWAHVDGQPWENRLTQWVPAGCDAYFVERETLDPYEYIEIWLADAGWMGSPQYLTKYRQWLEYFGACGVRSVGLGWVTMVKSGSDSPRVVAEQWGHSVSQPVADDLQAHIRALDYADWSDHRILDQTWVLAPGVVQETLGPVGRQDPATVVLRRVDGLRRAVQVDYEFGGVLGACDGELTLAQIVAAVAHLSGTDLGGLADMVMPKFRQLVAQTWLTPTGASAEDHLAG